MIDARVSIRATEATLLAGLSMRTSLLKHDPQIHSIGMPTLVGIANAIEHEALRRYAQLAETMEQRGEFETAAAFRTMLEQERAHVEAVARWAAELGQPVPAPEDFEWSLPPDLSASWNDIAGSALLTPYRAFAIAVVNEQRAFSFYAYLAAHANDSRVAAEAEKLASEELQHAALLRRWRRAAWHRERPARNEAPSKIGSVAELDDFVGRRLAAIAENHRSIAARLRNTGDDESAALLEELAASMPRRPGVSGMREVDTGEDVAADTGAQADAAAQAEAARTSNPAHLLIAAQKPLEALSEALEKLLGSVEGELFAASEKAATDVVAWLARISLQTERRMQQASN